MHTLVFRLIEFNEEEQQDNDIKWEKEHTDLTAYPLYCVEDT